MSDTQDSSPSATRAFLGGFGSGALSGAAMMGIVALLSPFFVPGAAIIATFMATAPLMSLAAGIFGGFLSAKHALSSPPAPVTRDPAQGVAAPGQTIDGPAIAPQQAAEPAQPARNWVASTARSADSQARIQQIIDNGSLSDKARAEAIHAERSAADTAQAR